MILDVRCFYHNVKSFGNKNIQLNSSDRGQSCLVNICGNAEFGIAKNLSNTVKQLLLGLILRLHDFFHFSLWQWKGFFVYLLVLIQRNLVDLHGNCRNHIWRLGFFDEIIQLIYVNLTVRYYISCNVFSTAIRIIKSYYGRILYAFVSSYDLLNLGKLNSKASDLNLGVFSSNDLDISIWKISGNITGMIQDFIAFCIVINILRINFRSFLRFIQITSGNLPSGNHQFTAGTVWKQMTKLIGYIKLEVIKCLSNWNVGIVLIYFKYGCKNCTLCRAISIKESIILRRLHRNKLLSAYGKILQALAAHFHCKLSSHLCSHKGMGNAILFKITLKCNEIKTDFFRNNVKLCTVCNCTVNVHHGSIKTKGRISCYFGAVIYMVILFVPVAECSDISIFQHTAFGHAGGAGSVQ